MSILLKTQVGVIYTFLVVHRYVSSELDVIFHVFAMVIAVELCIQVVTLLHACIILKQQR